MTWMNQAVHVARKDVVHARMALLAYAIITVIALLSAMALPLRAEDTSALTASVLVLLVFGTILGASAVQADSPTQSTAFWASRPFHPTAMLGAKILYCAVLIVGIPLVAELSGLLHYQTSTATIVADLTRSAAAYGLLLLATIVVASLTSDIRGFIVGALAIVVGLLAIVAIATISNMSSISNTSSDSATTSLTFNLVSAWSIRAIGLLGSLALLVWLYRRRDVSKVAWVGAVAVVGACVWLVVETSAGGAFAGERNTGIDTPSIAIDEAKIVARRDSGMAIGLRFSMPAPPPMRRAMLNVREVHLRLRDGTTVNAEPTWEPMTFDTPAAVLPAGIQPFGSRAGASMIETTIKLREEDRARLDKVGVASVDVKATVRVSTARQVGGATFGTAAKSTAAGTRVEIGRRRDPNLPYAIEVLTASVENGSSIGSSPTSVVVVNEQTREGLVLDSQRYGGSSSWMVLPGAPLWTSRVSFNTRRPRESGSSMRMFSTSGSTSSYDVETNVSSPAERFPDPAWYTGSKISVIEWVPSGYKEIRLSKALN